MSTGAGADLAAISQDAPCGPDLFDAGDDLFMSFCARVEGLLPSSFFSRVDGSPFDRTSVDLEAEYKAGGELAKRTHDLRLLSLLIKLHALDRRPEAVVELTERIALLLERHWDDLHPRPEDGDLTYRSGCVQALDDNLHVILPLQFTPLVPQSKGGGLSVRSIFIATGEVEKRESEDLIALKDLARRLDEKDLDDLAQAHTMLVRLSRAVEKIRSAWLERSGHEQSIRFDLLAPFASKACEAVAALLALRRPEFGKAQADLESRSTTGTAASGDTAKPLQSPDGRTIANHTEAILALNAAADYFANREPSNPALLLIRQAQQLIGKSFVEVLRILAPDHLASASLSIGNGHVLTIPVERFAEFGIIPCREPDGDASSTFAAESRLEAVELLEALIRYYASNEPSSPLPVFLERAKVLAHRDFIAILMDVLPEEALKLSPRREA